MKSAPDEKAYKIAVKVAVDNAAFKFDKLYTYGVPPELESRAEVGARVAVPFGKGDKKRVGIILERCEPESGIKAVAFCEDEPVLDQEQLKMLYWLKEATFCGYFDAVKTLLPKLCRAVVVSDDGRVSLADSLKTAYETAYLPTGGVKVSKRAGEILAAFGHREMTYSEIYELTGASRDTVARMCVNGALQKTERRRAKPIYSDYIKDGAELRLTQEQSDVCRDILSDMDKGKGRETLLQGVTSSGKTMVYFELISKMLCAGKGAILLVPEIAIATQTIKRLRAAFGAEVAVIHSSLSDSERLVEWQKIKSGECSVVVGTRSAVFAPVNRLGLIIVDEEQEQAYISEQNPRYSAVAAARVRAKLCGCHVLLSSATPSVADYFRAASGKSQLVKLTKRYLDMPLPAVETVDMRSELISGNAGQISQLLKSRIEERLEKKEQVMLLLNRRGYNTVAACTECREVQKCPNCDVPLVYGKRAGTMSCHYCGYSEPAFGNCKKCGGPLKFSGVGTQRIEEQLGDVFPKAKILRMDLDSASRKGEYEGRLGDFEKGKYDIIVGTQMIAKGLDFANVTLAAVLGVDQLLLMQDYRVYERAFSMLTQLVGRSGRGGTAGSAVIQTVDPTNPIISLAVSQDYEAFYRTEIALRKACLYPPFCAMYTVGLLSEREELAVGAAAALAGIIGELVTDNGHVPVRILGPSPFRVPYVSRLYRYKLTLKCRGDSEWNELLKRALQRFYEIKEYYSVRTFVDVNAGDDF